MTRRFDENIRIVAEGGTEYLECTRCDERLCSLADQYKDSLIQSVKSVEEANPLLIDPEQFIDEPMEYREYYCPSCGRLIESEIVTADREPIADKQLE